MDNMTLIAIASIVTAGLTIALGSIGPALGEGRAVATALSSLAQQPDAASTITRTPVCRAGDDRIDCDLLLRGLDDPHFRQSVLEPCHRPNRGQVTHADRLVHRRAQALNFLILVGLLKRFLYKPILNAVDAREKLVATELSDARAKMTEAQKERDDFQHKNEVFDQQRAALFSKATDEAKAERQRLLDEARKAADALSAKRQEALRSDFDSLDQAIRRRTQRKFLPSHARY